MQYEPEPLTATYWDAQRIAKGIADPSAYPKHRGNACLQQNKAQQVESWASYKTGLARPSMGFREAPPKSSDARPALSRPPEVPANSCHFRPPRPVDYKPDIVTPEHRLREIAVANPSCDSTKPPQSSMAPKKQHAFRRSLDFTSFRAPLPDRNYAGSVRSRLSSVSLNQINETFDEGAGAIGGANQSGFDIRNVIGLDPNIHQSGNTWIKCNLDDPRGLENDQVFGSIDYLETFVRAWVGAVADGVKASLSRDNGHNHWECDIDTTTGSLLPPVEYPNTIVDPKSLPDSLELDWHRQNWTSNLLIRRDRQRRWLRWGVGNGRNPPPPPPEPEPEPEVLDERLIVKVHEHVIPMTEYNHFVPRIRCFLRPAKKSDMEAVCNIYNWEVQHGFQTTDSSPLSVGDFEKVLSNIQQLGMPFIVAVRGSARDLNLTSGNCSFSPYRQVPFDKSQHQNSGEILGFAFLSVREPGLAGSCTGSSRAAAKVNVYVHPDYRRKKIGLSLLDMLLRTASDRFSSHSGYDFIDTEDNPIYKDPLYRRKSPDERKYFRLYFHYLVRHKHVTGGNKKMEQEQQTYDNDLVWIRKMLQDHLHFTEVVRFEAVHCSPKCREGPVQWLDEVVFEHSCHVDPRVLGKY